MGGVDDTVYDLTQAEYIVMIVTFVHIMIFWCYPEKCDDITPASHSVKLLFPKIQKTKYALM